jgi:hypothetical protein
MKLLFLDIDGVLNSHQPIDPLILSSTFDKDKVARLNRVLLATDAQIVLSTAWRYFIHRGEMTLEGMDWLLRSHGVIAKRLAGFTRADTMIDRPIWTGTQFWPATNERGQQIAEWIAGQARGDIIQSYAVVDDLDLGISAAGHPFVHTDGKIGITDENADELIRLLVSSGTVRGRC